MFKFYKMVLFIGTLIGLINQTQAQNKLAFIYQTDSTEASSYKIMLKAHGFETHLVELNDVANHDFSQEKLIISGSNSSDTWVSWGNDNLVATIKNTNKPIIAFCYGGSGLFTKMGLWNNGGMGASNGFGLSLKVVKPLDPIYNQPYAVTLNADSTFEPFTKTSCGSYLYTGNGYPTEHVTVYDRSNINQNRAYAGLVSDSSMYYYLGYAASNALTDFTKEGEHFFVNLVYQAGKFNFTVTEVASEIAQADKSILYPNPSTGVFYLNPAMITNRISVYNANGNLISDIAQPKESIDLSNLKAGVYTAKIQQNSKVICTKLIIE